jgi:hypothetical protein
MPRALTDRSLTPYGILPQCCPLSANPYAVWEMQGASQAFRREVTPELLRALSSPTASGRRECAARAAGLTILLA